MYTLLVVGDTTTMINRNILQKKEKKENKKK